jgi:hypothetical protein
MYAGELLDFKGRKMAKSAGGFTKLDDLIRDGSTQWHFAS